MKSRERGRRLSRQEDRRRFSSPSRRVPFTSRIRAAREKPPEAGAAMPVHFFSEKGLTLMFPKMSLNRRLLFTFFMVP